MSQWDNQDSVQSIKNRSYDPYFGVLTTEMLGFDSANNVLRRIQTDANGYLKLNSADLAGNFLLKTGDTAIGSYTFDTNTLFIDSVNHRLGIGTTSPTHTLEVLGTNNFPFQVKGSSGGGFIIGAYNSAWGGFWSAGVTPSLTNYGFILHPTAGLAFNITGGSMQFNTNDVVKMNLSSAGGLALGYANTDAGAGNMIITGRVGIGTTNPLSPLSVTATAVLPVSTGTGGNTITTSIENGVTYKIHTFTSGGTFTPPAGVTSVEYLVVAGGGSGGSLSGGGGAGGFRTGTVAVSAGANTVTVGAGGIGANPGTNNGGNSVFSTITSLGGGAGGAWANSNPTSGEKGVDGGSGGGASGYVSGSPYTGGAGTSGQGHDGGTGTYSGASYAGAGGGGAGAVGFNSVSKDIGGDGGAGTASSISGSSVTYAGGGGGGVDDAGSAGGAGGIGGGGAGSKIGAGTAGTANTGGGGGGSRNSNSGGNGGSGIVIIRYAVSSGASEQLRLSYDASNYNSFTVDSTGNLTISANGTNSNITLTPAGTGYTILNGNVGIGTTSPGAKLDVHGAGTTTGICLQTADSGGNAKFTILDNGAVSAVNQITSTLDVGTSPLAVTSTTVNTNLNADMLDGLHATDLAIVKQNIQITARTTAIGSTNITGTNTAGLYRVSYYLEDTTADITAGTIMATIGWTDDAGATTTSSVALPLTAVGRTSGVLYVRVLGTGSIQYSTTLVGVIGTSQYGLFITCEKLL